MVVWAIHHFCLQIHDNLYLTDHTQPRTRTYSLVDTWLQRHRFSLPRRELCHLSASDALFVVGIMCIASVIMAMLLMMAAPASVFSLRAAPAVALIFCMRAAPSVALIFCMRAALRVARIFRSLVPCSLDL
jgi:hypothetical protein